MFFEQVLMIIEGLPRFDLIGIQFFDVDGAGTGPVVAFLHLHAVLLLHLHERRPHPLVTAALPPLPPLPALLRTLSVVALRKHLLLRYLCFSQTNILTAGPRQRGALHVGRLGFRVWLCLGILERDGVGEGFFEVFADKVPHLLLDSELDLLLDEFAAVVVDGLGGRVLAGVFVVGGSADVSDGDGDAATGEVELELVNRACEQFTAQSLAFLGLQVQRFAHRPLAGL